MSFNSSSHFENNSDNEVLKVSENLYYKGYGGCDSVCKLDIHDKVVICTELNENPGTSITNLAEKLIEKVCEKYNLDMNEIIWFERYDDYARVTIVNGCAEWSFVSEAYARTIFERGYL